MVASERLFRQVCRNLKVKHRLSSDRLMHYDNKTNTLFFNDSLNILPSLKFHDIGHYIAQKNFRKYENWGLDKFKKTRYGIFKRVKCWKYSMLNVNYKECLAEIANFRILKIYCENVWDFTSMHYKWISTNYYALLAEKFESRNKYHYSDLPIITGEPTIDNIKIHIDHMIDDYIKSDLIT